MFEATVRQLQFMKILLNDEADHFLAGYQCGWVKGEGWHNFTEGEVKPLIEAGLVFECPPHCGWNRKDHGIAILTEDGQVFVKAQMKAVPKTKR